jgi:hypothetical protein
MNGIFFKTPDHKQRFLAAIRNLGRIYADNKLDQEYSAALYILTADLDIWNMASGYIDDEGIDFRAMLSEVDFSGGWHRLIKHAAHLFNYMDHPSIPVIELMHLDGHNLRIALDAIRLRYKQWTIREIEASND